MTGPEMPSHREIPPDQKGYELVTQDIIDKTRDRGRDFNPLLVKKRLQELFPQMDRRFWDGKV